MVVDGLGLVVITIDDENPFEIFESLNSTGLPLEESDLIRNFLFMQVPMVKQEAFDSKCWNKFEEIFQDDDTEAAKLAASFYRYYLMRNGEYSKAKCPHSFPMYRREPKKTRLILESNERSKGHKEEVKFDGLEIEHVMPQTIANDSHGKQWKSMLGDGWKEVHQTRLHTLGNLNLTGYNEKMSNSSFQTKRQELAGSNLEMNKEIAKKMSWTEVTIEERPMTVRNKEDWAAQHDWMCNTFIRLERLLSDRIRELNLSDFNAETRAEIEKWERSPDDGSSDSIVDSAEIFPGDDSEEAE